MAAVIILGLGAVACGAGNAAVARKTAAPPGTSSGAAAVAPAAVRPIVRPVVKPAPVAATVSVPTSPYFATPAQAMRYLASAYNRNDVTALMHLTTPAARADLQAMHGEAVNLQLDSCAPTSAGDYRCDFTHDYPAAMHRTRHGAASFIVAPARRPGWYMYLLARCG